MSNFIVGFLDIANQAHRHPQSPAEALLLSTTNVTDMVIGAIIHEKSLANIFLSDAQKISEYIL